MILQGQVKGGHPRNLRRVGKRGSPRTGGESGLGDLITLSVTIRNEEGQAATGEGLIDSGARTTVILEAWTRRKGLRAIPAAYETEARTATNERVVLRK